jgi:hypothetical protein
MDFRQIQSFEAEELPLLGVGRPDEGIRKAHDPTFQTPRIVRMARGILECSDQLAIHIHLPGRVDFERNTLHLPSVASVM